MTSIGDYARLLTEEARERKWPNVRPKDAATIMIIDRSKATPQLLFGKRHDSHKFMPGKFVFPGGRLDPVDRRMVAAGMLDERVERRLASRCARPSASRPRALALAAIRESFEETGLLLGSADYGTPENPPEGDWAQFASHGVFPDLEPIHFISRAITPPRRPKRFDTRFFAIDASAIAKRIDGIVGPDSELTELVWKPIDQAMELDLPGITRTMIRELADRIAAGFSHDLPVPFYYEVRRKWVRELL
ncbi:MAG: NUDIX hydrolase [Beijerinckiaceae bacterium]